MSVSVSQIGIGRLLDRSIDQSRFPGQSLDQSICVCRCLYKEQHPPTRSHFRRKILRLIETFFSISSSHPLDLSRDPYRLYPRSRDIVYTSRPGGELPRRSSERFRSSSRSQLRNVKHTRRILGSMQENCTMLGRMKSRGPRKLRTKCTEEHDEEGRESGTERRTMHRRPTWVPRTKLTRYVNCLSNLSPPSLPLLCIYRYI